MQLSLFSLSFLLVIIFQVAVAFFIDPLQNFRKASWYRPVYKAQVLDCYYLPGLIKHYNYDIALIGSSNMQNTSAQQIEKEFGGKALKATFSGAHSPETSEVLRLILDEGKAQTILLSLDLATFHGDGSIKRGVWPSYMYTQNDWQSWPYLFSVCVWPCLAKTLVVNLKSGNREAELAEDWDTLFSWGDGKQVSKERTIKKWQEMLHSAPSAISPNDLTNDLQLYQKLIGNQIHDHPSVKFYVFLPPYSILLWNAEYQRGSLNRQMAFKREVLMRLSREPNVDLFDYQNDAKLTWAPEHYYDLIHFDSGYNARVIAGLHQGQYQVKSEEIDAHILDLQTQAEHCEVKDDELVWKP